MPACARALARVYAWVLFLFFFTRLLFGSNQDAIRVTFSNTINKPEEFVDRDTCTFIALNVNDNSRHTRSLKV